MLFKLLTPIIEYVLMCIIYEEAKCRCNFLLARVGLCEHRSHVHFSFSLGSLKNYLYLEINF
jgi:hypothetical protein